MPDQVPPVLDRLWEEIPTGAAPVDQLIAAGGSRRRRRRRAVSIGAVALAIVAVGAASVVSADLPTRPQTPVTDQETPHPAGELDVRAFYPTDAAGERLLGDLADRATWNSRSHTVMYGSAMAFSGSCPPVPTAVLGDDGTLALALTSPTGGGLCTADARRALVVVRDVTERPTGLIVTDDSGKPERVAVDLWDPNLDLYSSPAAR